MSETMADMVSRPSCSPPVRPVPCRDLLTRGELEAEVGREFGRFEQDFMGRGPREVHVHLIDDLLVVRLIGVLTAAEKHLAQSRPPETGRILIKQVRRHLVETARPILGALIEQLTGVTVVSLHYDISTMTGEELILATLSESPRLRELKKR